jgi:hypothetical protein
MLTGGSERSDFVIASYASHYLGKHPYLWTAVAVGAVFVLHTLLEIVTSGFDLTWLAVAFSVHIFYLGACLAGAWYGRRHHAEFLEKKLARMKRKASREGRTSPSEPVPLLPATTTTVLPPAPPVLLPAPNATAPQQPSPTFGSDHMDQLKKLGDLRDAGVLTAEEFQTKKTEILGRI